MRSSPSLMQAAAHPGDTLAQAHVSMTPLGDVLAAKAWNSQLRHTIGRVQPGDPPPHLDFDMWVGPAPMTSTSKGFGPASSSST